MKRSRWWPIGVRSVIDRYGGEAILPWVDAGTQGMIQMTSLDQRFFARLGASRQTGSLCGATAGAGMAATYGGRKSADPMDVRFSKLVILWATNTRLTNRHLWPFIEQATGQRRPGRGHRPDPDDDGRLGRLVHSTAARHRRGTDAGRHACPDSGRS